MQRLTLLYQQWCGQEPLTIEKLAASGSNRTYYRLQGAGGTVIGVIGTSQEENHSFIYLSAHFASKGIPVPRVLAVSEDEKTYLQEDLGSTALYDALRSGRETGEYSAEQTNWLCQVMEWLAVIQWRGAEGLDFTQCYPLPAMNRTSVVFDLNYFKYDFLKLTGIDFNEVQLEHDLQQMADDLVKDTTHTFQYRDFQARNIMLREGKPYFIDFQGGRKGPIGYDVASFLWQASARYPQSLRDKLIGHYIQAVQAIQPIDEQAFRQQLQLFVLFRLIQVLGAYGFRGLIEQKSYFIQSIGPAIDNLQQLLTAHTFAYPYLVQVLTRVTELQRITLPNQTIVLKRKDHKPVETGAMSQSAYDGKGPLTVRVYSFSYKKGIPEDTSGNGGGYVFDCRATHNPGRYDRYKPLTGLDQPVIDFLEENGEILTFLNSVYQLADAHVERYMKRGFTDLMFSFGCTGGRHRSVYSAQHLAEHLHRKYGVRVILEHREQGIKTLFE